MDAYGVCGGKFEQLAANVVRFQLKAAIVPSSPTVNRVPQNEVRLGEPSLGKVADGHISLFIDTSRKCHCSASNGRT
jgi:hypothetical protein